MMFDQVNGQEYSVGVAAVDHMTEMMQRTAQPDEDTLGDAIALAGVAQYPARVKCALLAWMAWKDAAVIALAREER